MQLKLLRVENLKKYFPVRQGFFIQKIVAYIKAVDDISFEVERGKTFGLVGESGCGKTTVGKTIIRLLNPTSGRIFLENDNLASLKPSELKPYRTKLQIVFQDPMSSLNPRMTVGQMLSEPLLFHGIVKTREEANKVIAELLKAVGLKPHHIDRYPHQFSGGQRQRLAIARAISVKPHLIVLDEPTSALDVSVQAQIINLLQRLQEELNAGYIFISHDLPLVRYMSDEVAVMYLGKIVEKAPRDELFDHPLHPYTKALLAAAPVPDPRKKRDRKDLIGGQVPSPIYRPSGCFFHPRCKFRMPICEREYPPTFTLDSSHEVACYLYR